MGKFYIVWKEFNYGTMREKDRNSKKHFSRGKPKIKKGKKKYITQTQKKKR